MGVNIGIVHSQIRIDPDLHVAKVVDTDLPLFNLEIFRVCVDLGIALEGLHEDEEIIRVGYVLDPAESTEDMLDIDPGDKSLSTKLLLAFEDHKSCVDDVEFMVPPVE